MQSWLLPLFVCLCLSAGMWGGRQSGGKRSCVPPPASADSAKTCLNAPNFFAPVQQTPALVILGMIKTLRRYQKIGGEPSRGETKQRKMYLVKTVPLPPCWASATRYINNHYESRCFVSPRRFSNEIQFPFSRGGDERASCNV